MAPPHKADQREANQRGGGVERIDRGGVMGQGDQRAAGRRPGHRGELETAAAPGHRPGKVLARDQVRQKRRAGRPEERARRARREQAEIDPEHVGAQRRDQRQAQAGARDHQSHQHDNPLAVVVVGDVPRRQREQDHRHHLRQSHQAQGQRRVRPLIEFPADRHREHLLPQGSDQAADQVEHDIPVPQHGVGVVRRSQSAALRSSPALPQ